MSTKPAIKIENLSKQYRLGTVGTGTFSNDVNRWWHTVRGKPDPYLTIGESNDRTSKGSSDYVWALQDINFEVQPGEILGIIGKNGAGKSTLLKLLSRVTAPTTGKITAHGRIASLLEVGTGFHPELTGRENVFLNGAIMGMTKQEIRAKFDEIVEFSGCERYMDTPVKRYSSGMYVRLAFAVAAHLEPEILIVDEVLAVGDAEFQKKAIGKMQDVSKNEGRTVLFVSHNMASVQKLCTSGIIIENGKITQRGSIEDVVEIYLNKSISENNVSERTYEDAHKEVQFSKIALKNSEGKATNKMRFGEPFTVDLTIKSNMEKNIVEPLIAINTVQDIRIFTAISSDQNISYNFKENEVKTISVNFDTILTPGSYKIILDLRSGRNTSFDLKFETIVFEVTLKTYKDIVPNDKVLGLVREYPTWNLVE
jgi:lipopolysaccharide transport system ATP-binding protein